MVLALLEISVLNHVPTFSRIDNGLNIQPPRISLYFYSCASIRLSSKLPLEIMEKIHSLHELNLLPGILCHCMVQVFYTIMNGAGILYYMVGAQVKIFIGHLRDVVSYMSLLLTNPL